ncbi:hypothetical protein GDO78_008497 [Eleutherodactylus coqui]|uniref:Uncharacterized protein n=1 Tax=Eleutherodactylus coqui TaxID=57060 RepID=A0A8J6KAT0_ELECQ|nr:hypothetical protein GDO78_008497 [Eleutherodactylus coqui]
MISFINSIDLQTKHKTRSLLMPHITRTTQGKQKGQKVQWGSLKVSIRQITLPGHRYLTYKCYPSVLAPQFTHKVGWWET